PQSCSPCRSTADPALYTLSLHDALPIYKIDLFPKSVKRNRLREWVRRSAERRGLRPADVVLCSAAKGLHIDEVIATIDRRRQDRSEEHTSELQSRENLVCRLLLEKKKRK